eukprot:scaffold294216_cov33-Tisochrysis_lutea.AAC.2
MRCSSGWTTSASRITYSSYAGRPSTESGRTSRSSDSACESSRAASSGWSSRGRKLKLAHASRPSTMSCRVPSASVNDERVPNERLKTRGGERGDETDIPLGRGLHTSSPAKNQDGPPQNNHLNSLLPRRSAEIGACVDSSV